MECDGNEIPTYDEIGKYNTDYKKPNYTFVYALERLPQSEALKFKDVENFDENSKGLIDLLASLLEKREIVKFFL